MSTGRVLAADAGAVDLGARAADVLATATVALVEDGPELGLWEAGPGEDTDEEVDEVFLVLSGSGEVTFEDGSRVSLRPGVLVRLRAGDRTIWRVTERLRKLYVATDDQGAGGGGDRVLAGDATALALTREFPSGQWVIGGWPTARVEELGRLGSARVGLWETTTGVVADIEQDECLLVLSGSGTVRFEDDGEAVDLHPGLLLRLRDGERAEWQVGTDLRVLSVAWSRS
ncbi:DUF861 domain-containing protein [Nocardioides guangzhouensis]|uniref:DUF861 domain-containing protein n=1 Tax=Nocardioides guangzhouensis TaxID=2497878 RepID=A0A4Q4Z9K9_9ACTN|nr:cupin domain-containing protein [Nocardioides guangzhouensis]RYP84155.1 DUF861 domain-containing protein [Nocardioides guangzhouensis]